jgi:hypothetical protein
MPGCGEATSGGRPRDAGPDDELSEEPQTRQALAEVNSRLRKRAPFHSLGRFGLSSAFSPSGSVPRDVSEAGDQKNEPAQKPRRTP